MNAGTVESFARLARTFVLPATYKLRCGGLHRLREQFSRALNAKRSVSLQGPVCDRCPRRKRQEISSLMVAAWVALLLCIVAYAAVRGESALSDLDEVRLITDF